jgi:hypothetical protein
LCHATTIRLGVSELPTQNLVYCYVYFPPVILYHFLSLGLATAKRCPL